MKRDLSDFVSGHSTRVKILYAVWSLFENLVFVFFVTPNFLRVNLLRLFGAKIGKGVRIKRGVRIHFPWNLEIGNHSWIGEDVYILNHAKVVIQDNVCISQKVVICSSGHNYHLTKFDYQHAEIIIREGVWVCIGAMILANSNIGKNSVISAGETFKGHISENVLRKEGKNIKIDYSLWE